MAEQKQPTIRDSLEHIRNLGYEVIEHRDRLQKEVNKLRFSTYISVAVAVLSVSLTVLDRRFPDFYASLERVIGVYASRIVVSIAVIALGIGAHYFKRYSQLWYGAVEVIIGAASGISIAVGLRPNESMFSRWAALAGCVYVIARGLNNISDARRIRTSAPSGT